MQAASNRTFICSVVFLDIVGYSKKPVVEQIQIKERLNALLTEALANVAVNDRIILDTGDGAALSFLGDPEDALFVSLSIRDAIVAPSPQGPELALRLGVNLGPVKLVKDINNQPNIIGDGINVAQRVMSFARPGQILVSRSYYEVVSCLSEDYGKLFHYEGSRTDKHVREHEVYAVEAGGEALKRVAAATPARKGPSRRGPVVFDLFSQSASVAMDHLRRKPRLGTALAVIAILALAVGLRVSRQPPAAAVAVPLPTSPPAKVAAAPGPVAEKESPPAPLPEKPLVAPSRSVAVPPKPAAVSPGVAASPAKPATTPKTKKPLEAEAPPKVAAVGAPAVINFAISPWGEVYIDGKKRGVAPPLRDVEVDPGQHTIEVRNADFPPHVAVVDAKAGSRIRIRHKFR